MKRLIEWIDNNILFILTLFLLAFIPLYPKLPLINVQHTWVYVRVEDFLILFTYLVWIIQFIRKKVVINTPLTIPILIFWIIGGIATIHGVLLIFPTLSNLFPNVAFLNYLRRVEYIGLFFVGYSGIKDKKYISYVIAVLTITLLLVCFYGFGQKYLGFPAFLTMNEEFAKGTAMYLSNLSRIPSTFGGQYDLAAYLVLIIPILASAIFGVKNLFIKIILFGTVCLGFILMFMTVSRAAFIILLLSLMATLILHKKKLIVLILFIMALISLSFTSSLSQRFGNTLKRIDVLVDAKTGNSLGNVQEVPSSFFKDKIVRRFAKTDQEVSTTSAYLPFSLIPQTAALVVEPNASTGESLPQGTGYINLPLTSISKKVMQYFYQKQVTVDNVQRNEVYVLYGNFLIKRAIAYDLSFTTRFQGEWPNALMLFKKNIFFGSGYSSTGIAVDNNYLRILGEIGLFGLFSFFGLFLIVGIYIKRIFREIDSPITKSFFIGFIAGTFGLMLNAIFIDVFEASKIAYVFWLLMGVVLGIVMLYQKVQLNLIKELKKVLTSTYAIISYLLVTTIVVFSTSISNFFVGDDYTWLHWAADCNIGVNKLQSCQSVIFRILPYFTSSDGFFYRPGTKIYFLLMYSGFWLNQAIYHLASILLHSIVVVLVFLLARKILKNFRLSVLSAFLFLILSGYSEAIFWISSVGFIFNAFFILISLLMFISWKEKRKNIYFVISIISIFLSLLFHEMGVVAPLLIILYDFISHENLSYKNLFKKYYLIILSPIVPYLLLRLISHSHWFNGDYSYNLVKLPFNIIGNTIGYLGLSFVGPIFLPFYEILRNFSKINLIPASIISLIIIILTVMFFKFVFKNTKKEEQKIIIFSFSFFIISLLPFLGLGNITLRYGYLASIGFIFLFVLLLGKLYEYLLVNGKGIATLITIIIISIFCLNQLIELQKIQGDWDNAGKEAQNFFISLNEVYDNEWTRLPMQFYFVNMPIKSGDAWVFPVGLPDAIWFVFQNESISVNQSQSVDQSLYNVKNPETDRVFQFNDDGSFVEKNNIKK